MKPLKLAASRPDRHIHPQPRRMHFPHMLIHGGSSLRAPIALGVVGTSMYTENSQTVH